MVFYDVLKQFDAQVFDIIWLFVNETDLFNIINQSSTAIDDE